MTIRKETLLRHAALFFAIMASGGNNLVPREAWVMLTFVSCLALLDWRIPVRHNYALTYLWISLVIPLLFLLQGLDSIVSIASRLVTFLAAILLLEVYLTRSVPLLMADLFNILKLMAIQAILTFLLGNVAKEAFATVEVQGTTYYTLGFLFNFHYAHSEIAQYVRPDGFFYEPGVLQIYINIFLYMTLFWRVQVLWAAIACAALVTVWSTIGLMVAAFLLILSLPRLIRELPRSQLFLVAMGLMIAIPTVGYLAIVNYDEKVNGELRGSFLAREYDFYTGLNIVKDRPFTGIGFGLDTYLHYNQALGYDTSELRWELTSERPNSNGLMQVLYTIGIPLGLPLLLGMFTQRLFSRRFPMAIVLAVSFYGQSLVFTPFFLFILFSGFPLLPKQRFHLRARPA
jgi:hypothetical protein